MKGFNKPSERASKTRATITSSFETAKADTANDR